MPGRGMLNLRGPKYERIEVADPWAGLDDDEDDDELLFSGNAAHRWPTETHDEAAQKTLNGENGSGKYKQLEQLTIDVEEEEGQFVYDRRLLERQGSPLHKKYKKFSYRNGGGWFSCMNKKRCICAAVLTVVTITIICLFYFLLHHRSSSSPSSSLSSPSPSSSLLRRSSSPLPLPLFKGSSQEFSVNITGATESTVRLFDVNGDGVLDVIFGYARIMQTTDDMEAFCAFLSMTVPCAGAVRAVDGRSGALLWELNLESEAFAILCGHLDANEDGIKDCLIAGRLGVLYAVDSTNGASIWSADPAVTNTSWNFYQPQVVPDLDGDNVLDVVVTHGGNGAYRAKQTERDANRIMLLSGKTGKSLGQYLETPDRKETYSAVTVYKREDDSMYVLFGTGGETVKGSLWSISLWDLYCHVMGYGARCLEASQVPALQKGSYGDTWGEPLRITESGAREIIRSGSNKGVMVPTVFIDLNRDGTPDLLVSLFNGTTAVLDGTDLSLLWTTGDRFGEYETYSDPAPGHFNSDDIPDIMIRLSHGNWSSKYNSTVLFILDGRDGHLLWSTQSHSAEPVMSSPLTVKDHNNKDAFVFWTQGRRNNDTKILQLTGKGHLSQKDDRKHRRYGDEGHKHRRHGDDEATPDDICYHSSAPYESELFVLNRDHAWKPLRVTTVEPYKYYYNVAEEKASIFSPKKDLSRQKRHMKSSNSSDIPEDAVHPTELMDGDSDISSTPVEKGQDGFHKTPNNVTIVGTVEPSTVTSRKTDHSTMYRTNPSLTLMPSKTDINDSTKHNTSPTLKTSSNNTPLSLVTRSNRPESSPSLRKTTPSLGTTIIRPKIPPSLGTTSSYPKTTPSLNPMPIYTDDPEPDVGPHQMLDYPLEDTHEDEDVTYSPGEDYPGDMEKINDNVTLCSMYTTWSRSTGAIADMDKDGNIDIVHLINYMVMIKDAFGGYIGSKSYVTVVKKRLLATSQDCVALDPERTFYDASIPRGTDEGDGQFDLLPEESRWMGYMGTMGDGYFDDDAE